jgi:hypothetical protein
MGNSNKIPIERFNNFFDETDFQLDVDMARECVEHDINTTVVLFRIDRDKTNTDDIYGESDPNEVTYKTPIELKVASLKIEPSESKSYNPNGMIRYQEYGNLIFHVLVEMLGEKQIDIEYGDIVGYADREDNFKYWEVSDDGKIYSDNAHTHFGYKGVYRSIKCVPIDPNIFNGI